MYFDEEEGVGEILGQVTNHFNTQSFFFFLRGYIREG